MLDKTKRTESQIFWCFTLIHGFLWTIMPTIMRYALPHDTIEGFMWGQHLDWGYDKNPFLNAWLTRLGYEIGGTTGIGIYFLSSLFVMISFWSVWQLSRQLFKKLSFYYYLAPVLLLEGCINYTLVPQSFNDNLIELGLWPLMFLCFYQAIKTQKILHWLLTGITAALSMMAKYYTAVPLIIMALFLFINHKARASFRSKGIYGGLCLSVLCMLPHIIWLFQHEFLTVHYALHRASSDAHHSHNGNAVQFGLAQMINFLMPVMIILIFKLRYNASNPNPNPNPNPMVASQFDRQFLWFLSLGPFLLSLLLSLIFHWHLYNEWGVPLASLWGLLLIILFKPVLTENIFKKLLITSYIIMFLWPIGYCVGLWIDGRHTHSDNYPAQAIADYVTEQWQHQYHKPLRYVAGSRYIGGYIAFYAKDHPSVLAEWTPLFSPWINMQDFHAYGAVFIQDNYYGTTVFGEHPNTKQGQKFPETVLQKYPNLIILPVKYFYPHRGGKKAIPVLIGFLPPAVV